MADRRQSNIDERLPQLQSGSSASYALPQTVVTRPGFATLIPIRGSSRSLPSAKLDRIASTVEIDEKAESIRLRFTSSPGRSRTELGALTLRSQLAGGGPMTALGPARIWPLPSLTNPSTIRLERPGKTGILPSKGGAIDL